MVSAGSNQAKGFAVQISLLLESIPNLELGESTEFPASKILTDKIVHRYISFNDKVGVEEAADAPPMKKAPRKPAVSTKSPAIATTEEPVPKKKRTSKKKSGSSSSPLEIVVVAQEVVPLQMVEPSTGVPTAKEPIEQSAAEEDISADQLVDKVTGVVGGGEWAAERLVATPDDTDEEIEAERPVFESVEAVAPVFEVCEAATDKDFLLVDDPDTVINQVIHQLDSISADKDDKSSDRAATWFDRALDEMLQNDEGAETMDVGTTGGDQQVQFSKEEPVEKSVDEFIDADEQKLLEDILLTIPVDVPLPSAGMEIIKIKMGKEIKIPEVNERTWFLNSLPKIHADNKAKAILVEKDPMKGNPTKEHYFLICADIDLLVNLKEEQVLIWGETEITHVALSRKSLFSWLPTADIKDFLSSIVLDRKIFRDVQIYQNIVSVAPSVQMLDEPSSSDSSSDNILMDFADQDTAAAANSLPAATVDLSSLLDDLKSSLSQRMDDANSEILSRLHSTERSLQTSLGHQNDYLRSLIRVLDNKDKFKMMLRSFVSMN
ncbi:hypothetical protein F511_43073 [Dorcoceras hygrometricum]|uniref:Uncharacterized protein n=1 Tax=Dorcoceras hygrometricum TaxID=472368 RepID=A0A2Z7BT14_9LAMI|nr:hypothetical protein F511_43073 [Dorcoceras hygrometricum]